jgi:hypothetical protein
MTDEIWWLNIVTQLGRAKVLMKNRKNDHRMVYLGHRAALSTGIYV